MEKLRPITLEGFALGFKNFTGEEGKYNRAGVRNFVVYIDDLKLADELRADGWNIKYPKPNADLNPEEDTRSPYLPVDITFGIYPPKVIMITEGTDRHEELFEDNIGVLDNVRIVNADIVIRPYSWTTPTGSGVKAYCKELYVTIANEGLRAKYGF